MTNSITSVVTNNGNITRINQPARCNKFSLLLLDVYLVVVVPVNRSDHDQQHCYHYASKAKTEAATAVVELLMMGVRTPETC